jgi:hypothetical protein
MTRMPRAMFNCPDQLPAGHSSKITAEQSYAISSSFDNARGRNFSGGSGATVSYNAASPRTAPISPHFFGGPAFHCPAVPEWSTEATTGPLLNAQPQSSLKRKERSPSQVDEGRKALRLK